MAFRIHVTAVRDSTAESVRKTYVDILGDGFANVQLVEHSGWVSFRTSVWQVSSRDLIQGLRQLDKPGLQFTTQDGSRWFVTMCKPGIEPESMIHEFGYHEDKELDPDDFEVEEDDNFVDPELAFLEDELQSPTRPQTPFQRFAEEFTDLGAPLPQSLMDEVESLSFNAAIHRFRNWHQDQLVGFLTSAGIPCDEDAVRRTLDWQGMTESEIDSDLGNLPRLLMEIGLGAEWETYIADAEKSDTQDDADEEEEEDKPEADLPPEPKPFIDEVEKIIGPIETHVIEGEPVQLSLKQFEKVTFFPECCRKQNEIKAILTVELPTLFESANLDQLLGSKMDRVDCVWIPRGVKIAFENQLLVNWNHFREQLGLELCQFIEQLPDHSTFTLAFGAEDEPATRQIYRGMISSHVWYIDSTSPHLPAPVLADALSLAADAPKTKHILRDNAEADAVMEAVKRDSYLNGMDVRREENIVSCEFDFEFLAKIIFRLRFRDYWNVDPHEKHAELEFQKRIKMEWEFRRNAAKAARLQMAPRIGDPIYRGSAGVYWKSNLNHFEQLDPETLEKFHRGMKSLNFSQLGDLNAKRFRNFVLRCYISPDRTSYACLTASKFGIFCWDFISDFSDGSRLTTTTSEMAYSRPQVKLYFRDFSGLDVDSLYEKHLDVFARFKEGKNAVPVQLTPSLEGVATMFDDTLVRTDQDEANNPDDFDDDEDEDDF